MQEQYDKIAIVNFLDDYNKKDYAFALYDDEFKLLSTIQSAPLVIVNPRSKENRVIGVLKKVIDAKDYKGIKITAEVIAVADMDSYNQRIIERERAVALEKEKKTIEKELNEEIKKEYSLDFYEKMVEQYPKNQRIKELVEKLKNISQ